MNRRQALIGSSSFVAASVIPRLSLGSQKDVVIQYIENEHIIFSPRGNLVVAEIMNRPYRLGCTVDGLDPSVALDHWFTECKLFKQQNKAHKITNMRLDALEFTMKRTIDNILSADPLYDDCYKSMGFVLFR